MSTEEDLGKEDSTSSDRVAYIMRSIRYNQKTTNEFESGRTQGRKNCVQEDGISTFTYLFLFTDSIPSSRMCFDSQTWSWILVLMVCTQLLFDEFS